jgi:hypothetical protein
MRWRSTGWNRALLSNRPNSAAVGRRVLLLYPKLGHLSAQNDTSRRALQAIASRDNATDGSGTSNGGSTGKGS